MASTIPDCLFGNDCNRPNCHFAHQPRTPICKFGATCTRKNCGFVHPSSVSTASVPTPGGLTRTPSLTVQFSGSQSSCPIVLRSTSDTDVDVGVDVGVVTIALGRADDGDGLAAK